MFLRNILTAIAVVAFAPEAFASDPPPTGPFDLPPFDVVAIDCSDRKPEGDLEIVAVLFRPGTGIVETLNATTDGDGRVTFDFGTGETGDLAQVVPSGSTVVRELIINGHPIGNPGDFGWNLNGGGGGGFNCNDTWDDGTSTLFVAEDF